LAADQHGFARDQAATVSLDDLASNMIYDSGNASTDYLLERVTTERMAAVIQEAGLAQHTPIRPTLGLVLAMFNHDNPPTTAGQLQPLMADLAANDTSLVDHLTNLYRHNHGWRSAQIEWMLSNQLLASLPPQEIWAYQLQASQLFPKATAREYAGLMARIASGRLFSAEVSRIMQGKLESVPSDWPLRLLFYDRLGAKDGSTAGVLTLASYAIPRRGRLAGQSRVVIILVNNLPAEIWSAQLSYQGHYLLQTDLARASGVFDRLTSLSERRLLGSYG
jgi:D-alanyl-D-alanine carboxypeptidase